MYEDENNNIKMFIDILDISGDVQILKCRVGGSGIDDEFYYSTPLRIYNNNNQVLVDINVYVSIIEIEDDEENHQNEKEQKELYQTLNDKLIQNKISYFTSLFVEDNIDEDDEETYDYKYNSPEDIEINNFNKHGISLFKE